MEWAEAIKEITAALANAPGLTLVLIIALIAALSLPVIGAFLIYTLSKMVKSYGDRDSALGHALGQQLDFMNRVDVRFADMAGAFDKVGDAMQVANSLANQTRGALEVTSAALLDMKQTVMNQHELFQGSLDTVKLDAHETLEIVKPIPAGVAATQVAIQTLESYFNRLEATLTAVNTSLDVLCEQCADKPAVKQMEILSGRIIGTLDGLRDDLKVVGKEVHELLARTAAPDGP